jgi:glutamate racemase
MIGVFDSGVGGLSVWNEIARQMPGEPILYLADQAHVPYGSRSLSEVCGFAEGITRFLLQQGAELLVIASNTTSAAALYPMRELFPGVPFVGMEPALKPAVEQTRSGVVGVIATQATFQGELFANLMERYAGNVRVIHQACPGLVEAVEAGALETSETEALLKKYLTPMMEAGVDQLVLGCTHYPFLRPAIEWVMGKRVAVIDPAPAVARRVAQMLSKPKGASPEGETEHGFYTSGDPETLSKRIELLVPSLKGCKPKVQKIRWRNGKLEYVSGIEEERRIT